ncbi:MAG: hemerythrin family protein [Ketobacteraceae bacterium]|nr:hemerythrin family protein [Ketobacteraceae bacterium]
MLKWSEFPRVELGFMDQDHEECLELLHLIVGLLDQESTKDTIIDERLDALDEHLKSHFAREETAMQETGFPPYYIHKTEHDSVLQQYQQALRDWHTERKRDVLKRFIAVSFMNWLETHALTMDSVTARHIQDCRG